MVTILTDNPRTDLTGARQGLFRLRSADGIVPFYRRHGHALSLFTSDLPFLSFHPPVFNPFLSIPLVAALPFSAVRPRGIGFFSKGNRRFPFLPMPAFCPWGLGKIFLSGCRAYFSLPAMADVHRHLSRQKNNPCGRKRAEKREIKKIG